MTKKIFRTIKKQKKGSAVEEGKKKEVKGRCKAIKAAQSLGK